MIEQVYSVNGEIIQTEAEAKRYVDHLKENQLPILLKQWLASRPMKHLDSLVESIVEDKTELIALLNGDFSCVDCSEEDAKLIPCPFLSEIHANYEEHLLCEKCAQLRAENI